MNRHPYKVFRNRRPFQKRAPPPTTNVDRIGSCGVLPNGSPWERSFQTMDELKKWTDTNNATIHAIWEYDS